MGKRKQPVSGVPKETQPNPPAPLLVSPAGPECSGRSLLSFWHRRSARQTRALRGTGCCPLAPVKPGSLMQVHRQLALLATCTASFVSQTPVPRLCLSSATVFGAGSQEVNTWNVLGTANLGFALPRRRGAAGQVRRGCRRWLAPRPARQRCQGRAKPLQGPCLCPCPSRPERVHSSLSPSLL